MLGLLLIFVVLATPSVSSQRVYSQGMSMPTFIVASPERAQYDSALTFSISAANVAQRETIDLQLFTGTNNEIMLQDTTLAFTQDGVQTWSVVVDSDRMLQHQQNRVELRAQHRSAVDRIEIDMDSLSGYIMIQTDKVIYTPRQTVMYRIIALDHDQRFAKWPLTVDIKNQDQIILERQHHTSQEAFRGRNFTLPRDALPGTWTISAYYQGKVMTSKFVTFEVQEYVLPTFTAKVKVEQKVIGQSTNWIQITTSAEYAYGQPVHGRVEMRLGMVRMNRQAGSQLTYIPFRQTYRGTLNVNGTWVKDVPISDLRYHDNWFPDGSRLYVTVNVTEAGTGENSTAVDIGTYFANPYYKISFTSSKKYFKPGFPYTLVVDVAAANGAPAAEVPVYVIMSLRDSVGHYLANGYSRLFILDQAGRTRDTFQVPENAETINVQVMTLDPRVLDWSQAGMDVSKFLSPSNQYLHLEKDGNNIDIRFTPSATSWLGTLEYITVLIYSRGTLIHTDTVPRTATGRQTVRLSPEVLRLAAPSARVLAYFYTSVGTGASTDIVSDSLFIDTDDLCREELSLGRLDDMGTGQQLPPKAPKEWADIVVNGGPNMTVGLLAVNKAVYFLKDERSLTREKMFHFLGEHDLGRGIGDGKDTEKIFEFAGVKFIKLTEAYNPSLPEVGEVIEVGRLNEFWKTARRNNQPFQEETDDGEAIPQDQVRRWFPESWFFTEVTLPSSGSMAQSFRLPDSITTWAFTAVGVGQDGGVCMSRPLDMVTFKPFFADVRLPYKAVRLEEVMVHIGIYNYRNFDINVTVTVTGDEGLCFSEGVGGNKQFRYQASLERRKTNSETLRVIPLVTGTVKLMVDVRSRNGQERDIVEKTLHVVAEGRRVTKAITFPLDPSGKHSSHHTPSSSGRIQQTNTATITNHINTKSSKQLTEIDLYMPEEIIQGTERCQISACGDLMGDIISHAVMEGNNLFESSVQDAEEVIGNLAPAVHALLYLNTSQFMTPHVLQKGKEHVIHGVARLLSYRKQSGSFALTTDSANSTWLTALVLKTLCHAEKIAYVDHAALIDVGFNWLLDQVDEEEGKLRELDRRLARPSREYDVMLNAEVLISLMECERTEQDDHNILLAHLLFPLEDSLEEITSPLVMAKTAYALTLIDPMQDLTVRAMQRLSEMKRTTHDGLHYWAVNNEDAPPTRPFWYHSGTRASSIEATAYALLVFSRQAEMHRSMRVQDDGAVQVVLPDWHVNLDSIAGWLIQKRNSRGAFIGAMDTAAATQALSQYSQAKLGLEEVNLHCNVTTSPMENYTHIFDFNEENAIHPKALTDVPVGRQLHVETRGTGLGQMQVRVEYNVPVEANALCRYNLTVTRRSMSYHRLSDSANDVCAYCNMGCEGVEQSVDTRSSNGGQTGRRRRRRQITSSRSSICLQVCLRSATRDYSDRTILEIEMLSGFQPYKTDLEQIYAKKESLSLRSLKWDEEKMAVIMTFDQVAHRQSTCVSFRALERRDVSRRNPAMVTVRAHEDPEPTCVQSYDPATPEMNLAVYCANNQASNQGQCRCFSGVCGTCITDYQTPSLSDITQLTCNSRYVYKIRQTRVNTSTEWIDIDADVISTERPGDYAETNLQIVTPVNCPCPRTFSLRTPVYFFGSHVDVFVNRANSRTRTYVADHTTTFVSQNLNDRTGQYIRLAATQTCPP